MNHPQPTEPQTGATPAVPKTSRAALGRGLADLIPIVRESAFKPYSSKFESEANGNTNEATSLTAEGLVRELSVDEITANPHQPRTRFDTAALEELANSIRENGLLQPILVRPKQGKNGYEIVAGERRWRAAQIAELRRIPVVVRDLSDADTLALALIENLIREDIGPLETARAFRRLIDEYEWTQEDLAKRVGKSRSAVANSLRLLNLPGYILESLESGAITEGHARALLLGGSRAEEADAQSGAVPFRDRQSAAWSATVRQGLPVRETERLMSMPGTGAILAKANATARAGAAAYDPTRILQKPLAPEENEPIFSAAELDGSQAQRRTIGSNLSPSTNSNPDQTPPPPLLSLRDDGAGGEIADIGDLQEIENKLRTHLGVRVRFSGDGYRGRLEFQYYSSHDLVAILSGFSEVLQSGTKQDYERAARP